MSRISSHANPGSTARVDSAYLIAVPRIDRPLSGQCVRRPNVGVIDGRHRWALPRPFAWGAIPPTSCLVRARGWDPCRTFVGYGEKQKPSFWIGEQTTGGPNRENHIAFVAANRAKVREFFDVAVAAGAEVLYEPRVWPEYHPNYYGAFVRDPDGNNVEAVCHYPE